MTARSDHAGAFEGQVRALCEGFARELGDREGEVLFAGQVTTYAVVRSRLRAMADAFTAVHQAERALGQAIADRRRAMPGFRSTYGDAAVFLRHLFGKDSPRLVSFGVRPPKVREPLSAEAAAIARAKAAATRKARGNKGKRQRLAIGGAPEPTLVVVGPDGHPLGSGVSTSPRRNAPAQALVAPGPSEGDAPDGKVFHPAPASLGPESP